MKNYIKRTLSGMGLGAPLVYSLFVNPVENFSKNQELRHEREQIIYQIKEGIYNKESKLERLNSEIWQTDIHASFQSMAFFYPATLTSAFISNGIYGIYTRRNERKRKESPLASRIARPQEQ